MKTIKQLRGVEYLANMFAEMKPVYKQKHEFPEGKITCSTDIYKYLQSIWDKDTLNYTETMLLLLLNRQNKIIGWVKISTGGMAGTVVDPKVVFALALQGCATSIILAHNHPSGNLKPSEADINLTQKMIQAGKLLDIVVLDHIIMTSEGYYSFSDEGRIY